MTRGEDLTRGQVLLLAVFFEGGLLLLWLFLASLLEISPRSQGRTSLRALALGLAGTVPLIPLVWWLSRSKARVLRRLMKTVDELLVPVLRPLTVTDFFLVAILAGVGEEGLFRGIIQGYLSGPLGEEGALVAAAAAFGLMHFVTPLYAVFAGFMGLYLGWLFLSTGNLLVPMIVHSLYDFIALVYLVRIRDRGERSGSGAGERRRS